MDRSTLYQAFEQCLSASYQTVENNGDFSIQKVGNTLKLFFEWSDGKKDWRNNLRFFAIPRKPYKNMKHIWFCHRGFLRVWKSIEPYISQEILNPEIRKIEIVGYSHGAAIALLCYEYCAFNRSDIEVQGFGFGCPRVFWGIVPKSVKHRFKHFYVIKKGRDIVTHVPPRIFGFKHISPIISIGEYSMFTYVKKFFLLLFGILDHYPEEYLNNLK